MTSADAPFRGLSDIDVGADGNVYLLDSDRQSISVFDENGVFVRSLGQAQGKIGIARGFYVGADGQIWVASTSLSKILLLDANGAEISQVALGDEKTPDQPVDVIALQNGTLLVAEGGRGELMVLMSNGELLARQRVPRFNTADGAHFSTNAAGEVFVSNPEAGTVSQIDEQGNVQKNWQFMLDSQQRAKIVGAGVSENGEIWAADLIQGGVIHFVPPGFPNDASS